MSTAPNRSAVIRIDEILPTTFPRMRTDRERGFVWPRCAYCQHANYKHVLSPSLRARCCSEGTCACTVPA
jgi:hypothetical protein